MITLQHSQVKLFVELFSSKFQGPFFKALRSENDEQLMEAAKSLEYGLEVEHAQCNAWWQYSSGIGAAQHLLAFENACTSCPLQAGSHASLNKRLPQ